MNNIFGDLLRKRCWRDYKLADFNTVWRKTHACSINGLIMAKFNLVISMQLPNHQIKSLSIFLLIRCTHIQWDVVANS